PQQAPVPVAVHSELVSFGSDSGSQLRSPLDLLTGEEEGCLHAGGVQELEYRRRSVRVRAVVEGQCDPFPDPVAHAEETPRRRHRLPAIAIDGCGWALQAVALGLAPLTVVQPALAAGLVFLLAIGVWAMGERVGRTEVAAVLAIAAGVAGLGWAAPAHSTDHASSGALALVFAVFAAVALVPYALARRARRAEPLLAAGAGVAFAFAGLAMKFVT